MLSVCVRALTRYSPCHLTHLTRARGSPTASKRCFHPDTMFDHHASEVNVKKSVGLYFKLQDDGRLQLLKTTEGLTTSQLQERIHHLAAVSEQILPLLYDIRRLCGKKELHDASWAKSLEHAAFHTLKMFSGPAFVKIDQLSCSPYAPAHIQELAEAAKHSETVHKTHSHVDYMRKFGQFRMVHAAYNAAVPNDILAVLYSAILPVIPAGMRDIDAHSGGPPPATGMWSLSKEPTGPEGGSSPTRRLESCNTAAFYSVSAPHQGIRGIKMGTRIIYSVASSIATECPSITTFCTLSPIPGFVDWIAEQATIVGTNAILSLIDDHDKAAISSSYKLLLSSSIPDSATALAEIARGTAWYHNAATKTMLKPVLVKLCRMYLTQPAGRHEHPLCKVAGFHLGNGAQMKRILWDADHSEAGIKRSASLMVNYVYSETGMKGLEETMHINAPRFASSPGDVLREQRPIIVD